MKTLFDSELRELKDVLELVEITVRMWNRRSKTLLLFPSPPLTMLPSHEGLDLFEP